MGRPVELARSDVEGRSPKVAAAGMFWGCLALSTGAFLLPLDGPVVDSAFRLESWFGVPFDKLMHTSIFAGLVFLAGRAQRAARLRPAWSGLLVVVVGHLLYALFIEACQHVIPWRSFEFLDLVANTIGIALGTLTMIAARRSQAKVEP